MAPAARMLSLPTRAGERGAGVSRVRSVKAETIKCCGGHPHLPGIRRRDGSLGCARCGVQLQPPSPDRAWGRGSAALQRLQPDLGRNQPEAGVETARAVLSELAPQGVAFPLGAK
jgi:hypothetical protein